MTKKDLIERIAARPGVGMNKRTVGVLVDAVFASIAEYFIEARVGRRKAARLSVPGFGTFTKKRKAPRSVRNPRTGEFLTIPETLTLSFQPGQELKAHLNRVDRKRQSG